jgi:hypothetical protein
MLNRHPEIGLCDETFYFYYVYNRQRAFGDLTDPSNRQRLVERYLATHRMLRLQLDREALAAVLLEEGTSYEEFFLALLRFFARSLGKRRFGEKTPQHAWEAQRLLDLYPEARIVHLIRDPRDVVASLNRMPWGEGSASANARVWQSCVRAAERCAGHPRFLRVRYEDLIADAEAVLRELCSFLGEDYEACMLHPTEGTQADQWWFQRAQGPLSSDRLEKWRQELTSKEVALIEWIARETLLQHGYEPVGERVRSGDRLRAQLVETGLSVAGRLRKLPRLWYHWFQPTQLAAEEAWIDGSHRSR